MSVGPCPFSVAEAVTEEGPLGPRGARWPRHRGPWGCESTEMTRGPHTDKTRTKAPRRPLTGTGPTVTVPSSTEDRL